MRQSYQTREAEKRGYDEENEQLGWNMLDIGDALLEGVEERTIHGVEQSMPRRAMWPQHRRVWIEEVRLQPLSDLGLIRLAPAHQ